MLKDFKYLGLIKELQSEEYNWNKAPSVGGVYIVIYRKSTKSDFLPEGTGGFFKKKDPNVPAEILNEKWVDFETSDNNILYIGKAGGKNTKTTLKNRVRMYMRFGNKKPVAHWGGRYIWQIADSGNLEVYWKKSDDPREEEKELIREFKGNHEGKFPFANLIN